MIQKLINLDNPENEDKLKEGGEAVGFFQRDFGITEWDWPQGVGLYGLFRVMKYCKSDTYRDFLYDWFRRDITEGLPSRNINTTTPLLTLVELNEEYNDKEFETLCLDWADWLMNCIPRTKVSNQIVKLTAKEFDILALLIMHPKRVFTYEMIMDLVWHEDYTFYSRKAVNNHMSNLRKKLKIAPRYTRLYKKCLWRRL